MNILDAKQALLQGHKVSHEVFTNNPYCRFNRTKYSNWMYYKNNQIYDANDKPSGSIEKVFDNAQQYGWILIEDNRVDRKCIYCGSYSLDNTFNCYNCNHTNHF